MQTRRAAVARITTKTVIALCLFLAATSGTFVASSSNASAAPHQFLKNYQLYDRSQDIRSLQQLLNAQGDIVAQSGPGSPGNETSIFGLHTLQALKNFQAAHGLPMTGYFGPLTRADINSGGATANSSQNTSSTISGTTATTTASTTPPLSTPLPGYAPGQLIFGGGGPPPPTCTISASPTNISIGSSTLLTWSSSNASTASLNQGVGSVSLNGSESVSPTTNTTYILTVGDSQGSTASCSTNTSATDTTSPAVTLTSPTAGSTLSGASVTLTATSSDNVGVAGVQFKVDGANVGASGTASPYSISWDSTSVSDGSHTIAAVAHDAALNYATSSISVAVDNTPPVISSISSGTPTATGATITWTTNENATSTVNYGADTSYGTASTSASLVTSHSITLTGLTAGTTYHYQVGSADVQGNVAMSSDQTFSTKAVETFFPVANRTFVPNESGGSSNTDILSYTPHFLMDNVNGTIRVRWANWRATTGLGANGGAAEVGSGGTLSAMANITYYDHNLGQFVTTPLLDRSTGLTSLSAADGEEIDSYANINAQAGDYIWIKIAGVFAGPTGMVYSQKEADINNGELFQFGSSWLNGSTDLASMLATTPTNSYAAGLSHFGPISIRSQTSISSYALAGDSRSSGLFDVPNDQYGNIGTAVRLFGKRVPLVNVAVPGDTAQDFAISSQSSRRQALLQEANSTKVFIALGTNDVIFLGRTASDTLADINVIGAAIGKTVIPMTLDPATDVSNTSIARPAAETQRKAFNGAVRASSQYLDPAIVLEAAGQTGFWASASYEGDGTHETNTGNQYYADHPAANELTIINNAPVVAAGFSYSTGTAYQSLGFTDSWGTLQATLATANLYSPEHKKTAALITEDNSTNSHGAYKQPSLTLANTTRIATIFAKRVTGSRNLFLQIQRSDTFTDGRAAVNLGTGGLIYSSGSSGITVNSTTITQVGDYWKVVLSLTFSSGVASNPYVLIRP
jgi:lysophospholipase L1-like esterase